MVTVEKIAAALGATQKGSEWIAKCPAHDDSNPSLFFREAEDGKLLLHCFSGCEQSAVLAALRRLGLWGDGGEPRLYHKALPPGISFLYPPTAILKRQGIQPSPENQKAYRRHWLYRDHSGNIVGIDVRYEGHGKKDVIPFFRQWPDGRWRSGHETKTGRSLYGIPSLKGAERVWVVEGCKTAEALQEAFKSTGSTDGVVSWPGGAKSWNKADWSTLKSIATICLWPDNDIPGINAIRAIGAELVNLRGGATGIMIVEVDKIAPKSVDGWDAADYLKTDTPESLLTLPTLPLGELPPAAVKKEKKTKEPKVLHLVTDLGNAARFVDMFGDNVRYADPVGWFTCLDGVWSHDRTGVVMRMAAEVARTLYREAATIDDEKERAAAVRAAMVSQNINRLIAMYKIAQNIEGITMSINEFDAEPYLLGVKNGVVDLRTGELLPADRKYYITRCAPVQYKPDAICPLWEKFLHRIMGGNVEMIEYLRRAIGYSLTGSCEEQVMFLMWGGGQNGKSVFAETLSAMMGSYHCSTPSEMLLLDARGDAATGSNSIARLKGPRFVTGSEIPKGAKFNETRVKELTGEDTVSARFLFKEFFEFKPKFKLWIRSNYRPEISGTDAGIWRRIQCVPFAEQISPEEKDKHLGEKLLEELPGILAWAVSGCLAWQRDGLTLPARVADAVAVYKGDMDSLGDFLGERCTVAEGATVSATHIYGSYKDWCETSGERPLSMRKLSVALRDRGFHRVNGSSGRYYKGIELRCSISPGEFEEFPEESGILNPDSLF